MKVFGDAVEKFAELLLAVGVVETLHRHGVAQGPERVERGAAHFLGGGVFVDEVRVGFLEILKFAVEAIVGRIGNLRTGLNVIEAVVTTDLFEEFGVALGRAGAHRRDRRRQARPREMPRMSASQSAKETSRPGARRWTCSSAAPRSEPTVPRAMEG